MSDTYNETTFLRENDQWNGQSIAYKDSVPYSYNWQDWYNNENINTSREESDIYINRFSRFWSQNNNNNVNK